MSVARLHRLIEHVRDPELASWLREGLEAWRSGEDLDRALGLSGAQAVRARDAAIRRVADLVDKRGELRPWPRAEKVARAVSHFEATGWRRLRGKADRSELPPLKHALLQWLEIEEAQGVRPVRNQVSIARIIT